ncbi:MAG: TIGR03986 family CRISPR-associated RAMP protein [Candidatus Kuenenia sp.]|nr:TIGR03986 family CRISPR-associated RAMP protein [Candidatus Kuenenia hertensis]
MEKARLDISKNKKGDFIVKAIFANNSQMTVSIRDYPDVASLNGKEVEVERIKGQIEKVVYNGKTIFSKSQIPPQPHVQNSQRRNFQARNVNQPRNVHIQGNHTMHKQEPANAPYNFVPLNDKVVEAESVPDFNVYHHNKHTGYISLSIETKTPLYIRDTLTKAEMKKKEEVERDEKKKYKYINPDFFSPGRKHCIPGSSLRGMTRTMVEMVSYSRMQFIDHKKKYHFRSFADKSLDLRNDYTSRMMTGNDTTGHHQQVKAGYLIKVGTAYKIRPAKEITPQSNLQYARVEESLVLSKGVLTNSMNNNGYKMGYKSVECLCVLPQRYNHSKPLYYAKVTDISDVGKGTLSNPIKGVLVHSGKMQGRPRGKHMHWIIAEADNTVTPLEFMDGVIENYRNDSDRKVDKDAELLKKCRHGSDVPCFYIEENNKVVSFGHTGLFRLAYRKSVEEFLPPAHRNCSNPDIAETIFGNEKTFAGRVFFEDAGLKDVNQRGLAEYVPKILSTPKPTTFQHYLEQNQTITYETYPEEGYRGLQKYNDDTLLRGNKLYWHKTGEQSQWEEDKLTFWENDFNAVLRDNSITIDLFQAHIERQRNKIAVSLINLPSNLKDAIVRAVGKYEKQHTRIKPVEANNTFTGKIRFENLSDVELGAILFALQLPDGCCHKLGMGKPLGLGSVEITPKLFLSKRKDRYETLFAEWEESVPESTSEGENILHFKKKFAEYILGKTGQGKTDDPVKKLWEVDRMKELKTMLDFQNKPDDEKTKYMQIKNEHGKNEFTERKILPRPSEVKSSLRKQ